MVVFRRVRLMLRPVFLSISILFSAFPAQAQGEKAQCELIQVLFTSPPARFVAERGAKIEEGGWQSKSQPKSCNVFNLKEEKFSHRVTCDLIAEETEAALTRAYNSAVENVRSCVSKLPISSQFVEGSTRVEGLQWAYWEAKIGKDVYRVTLNLNLRSAGKSAHLTVEFLPSN
jgi:hypothetical protein